MMTINDLKQVAIYIDPSFMKTEINLSRKQCIRWLYEGVAEKIKGEYIPEDTMMFWEEKENDADDDFIRDQVQEIRGIDKNDVDFLGDNSVCIRAKALEDKGYIDLTDVDDCDIVFFDSHTQVLIIKNSLGQE